jgi:hypothetical protein
MALVKKLLSVLVLVLAFNFVLAIAAVGLVVASAGVDRAKLDQIKAVLYPPPPAPSPVAPPAPAAAEPLVDPTKRLEELLARSASVTAAEQVQFLRQAFDVQMAELDRRERELHDLQRQVEFAKGELIKERQALATQTKQLADRETRTTRLEQDAGFQTSLALYLSMPAKQVKDVFMDKPDAEVASFLAAMPARAASKIIKEFAKGDAEKRKIADVLAVLRGNSDVDKSWMNAVGTPNAPAGSASVADDARGPNQ